MPRTPPRTSLSAPRGLGLACSALLPLSYLVDAVAPGGTGGLLRLLFALTVPGLVVILLGWRALADTPVATVLRAFLLSPGVYAALVLGLGSLGLGIDACAALAAPLFATAGVLASFRRTAEAESDDSTRPIAWAPLLVLAGAAVAVLSIPGARALGDAPEHAAMAARLSLAGLPVEDPGLAGVAPSRPWALGFLLAVLAAHGGVAPMVAGAALSGAALLGFAGIGARLVPLATSSRAARWAGAGAVLAVPFAASWGAPLLWVSGSGLLDALPDSPVDPRHVFLAISGPGDSRHVTLLARCLEVGPTALLVASGALWLDGVLSERRGRWLQTGLTSLSVCALSPHAGLALLATALVALPRSRAHLLATAAGLLVTWPLVGPVLMAAAESPDMGRAGLIRHHGLGLFWNAPAVLAALAAGVAGLLRFRTRVLWMALAAPTAMSLLLALPDRAESELLLLASLPAGVLAWHAGAVLGRDQVAERRGLAAAVLLLALGAHGLTLYALLGSSAPRRSPWQEQGDLLVHQGRADRVAAYDWLRSHAAANAVVLEAPRRGRESHVTAATGRSSFLSRAHLPADPSPVRRRRRPLLEGLVGGVAPPAPLVERILREIPGREAYLLIETRTRRPDSLDAMSLDPVFSQGRVRVLQLREPRAR